MKKILLTLTLALTLMGCGVKTGLDRAPGDNFPREYPVN